MPIIELARALRQHREVELWATDPAAKGDLVAFCEATHRELVEIQVRDGLLQALIRSLT